MLIKNKMETKMKLPENIDESMSNPNFTAIQIAESNFEDIFLGQYFLIESLLERKEDEFNTLTGYLKEKESNNLPLLIQAIEDVKLIMNEDKERLGDCILKEAISIKKNINQKINEFSCLEERINILISKCKK